MPDNFLFMQQFYSGRQGFDWVTILSLFFVGLFLLVPRLAGHPLTGRSRRYFLGAMWFFVIKLLVHLIRMLLIHLAMYYNVMGGGRQGASPLAPLTLLVFPVLEGTLFVVGIVLFAAGLPGMFHREDRWGSMPRRADTEENLG